MSTRLLIATAVGALLLSGCATQPLLPPMSPIKLDSKSISNMNKEEVQSLLSKMMNQKVAEAGGAKFLKDPRHVAISTNGVHEGTADGRYVMWEKRLYSYVYGYYYDAEKSEITEIPVSKCTSSYLSGTSGTVHTFESDCPSNLYSPGEDFKNNVLAFRSYLVSEFPNFLANYNANKSK